MRLFDVDELKENHGKMMIFEVTGSSGGEQMSDYNIRIQKPSEDFDSCSDCIHFADSKEICILRRCVHAIAELKECYERKERGEGQWMGYNKDKNGWRRLDGSPTFITCSECGTTVVNGSARWNFCPHCGARMEDCDEQI